MKRLVFLWVHLPLLLTASEIDKVVQSAFTKSWEMENATYIRANAVDDYKNKTRFFLPTINLKTDHGLNRAQNSENGMNKLSDYAIEAKSFIFSMDQVDDISISKASRDVQDLKYNEKKNQFCLDVANLYLDYLHEKRKTSNNAQILEILNKQFDITSSEYRQGLKPRKDYLRLRAELRGTELDQLNQSITLKAAEDKLRDKIAADFNSFAFDPASLEVPQETVLEDEVKKESILEKSLEKELDYLKSNKDKTNHQLWPKLTLTAGYKVSDKNYWTNSDFNPRANQYWYGMLGIEYNIWDWGIQRRTQDITTRGFLVRENEVYQEMRNDQNQVDLVRQRIKVARRVYSARSLLLGDQRESFGLISRDYREGRINFLDYVSSLRAFGSAQLSVFEGLMDLNKAYFEILLHKGDLDEYFKVR